ncbi:MAG: molybdopterin biosynthesis protein MoeB [Deltaproteobacteria bacterium CG17_big_fil_post_rev_8_21_14_2_50_63_7]|nr:MAG: molybdopterin biosynthesis protein MoeB [Deltaproteobacteria bacterium CG17_big_fil_post_rev_8_21_14_2_50_63_7]
MPSFTELLEQVRTEVEFVEPGAAHTLWRNRAEQPALVFLDVREREEFDAGHLDGAVWLSRGLLELRIEAMVPDRGTQLLVYCAGDTRSAFAVKRLQELGYSRAKVLRMGFEGWKRAGFPVHIERTLSAEQRVRYGRHLRIPEVGDAGQQKLLDAKVLLLGAGGLGSAAAFYLAAAGVGTLGIVDSDVVDASNLQRQILHSSRRIGDSKVDSARETLNALNADVAVIPYGVRLTAENALSIIDGYDLVIDGADNFSTRYLVNDACVHLGLPNIHGSVYRFEGQVTVFSPPEGPCYRCLYPEAPPPELAPNCQEAGVLGVLPGVIGVLQATEAIKLILGVGAPLVGRLLCFDGLAGSFQTLKLKREASCPACGDDRRWTGLSDLSEHCAQQ